MLPANIGSIHARLDGLRSHARLVRGRAGVRVGVACVAPTASGKGEDGGKKGYDQLNHVGLRVVQCGQTPASVGSTAGASLFCAHNAQKDKVQ